VLGSVHRLSDADVAGTRVTEPVFAAMLSGPAAGIVAAAAIVLVLGAATEILSRLGEGAFAASVFVVPLVLLTASALALVPIGPLWMAIAWMLVRQGTTSAWAYAAAGAAAATGMPLLLPALIFVVATETVAGAVGWLIFFAWFALSGAIGGAFAGVRIASISRENGAAAD
jgi:hypothetical protein